MSIPTSRTTQSPDIQINTDLCTGCGLCVSVCSDHSLKINSNNIVQRSDNSAFDCIGCGHCMAICPTQAIEVFGRKLLPSDIYDLALDKNKNDNYEQLLSSLQKRRSVRDFKDKEVSKEIIEKILSAVKTAPIGIPPSDVNVLIFDTKEKNKTFAKDFSIYLKSIRYLTSNLFLTFMRPFWGKETDALFRSFIKPLFKIYTDDIDNGTNSINYDAPLAIYFYGSAYCDPADPIIAATYAMIAGENLGLGTCMIGAIHPLIQNGTKAKEFREKHNIKCKSKEGLFVIFGYSKVKYNKGIERSFASLTYA